MVKSIFQIVLVQLCSFKTTVETGDIIPYLKGPGRSMVSETKKLKKIFFTTKTLDF